MSFPKETPQMDDSLNLANSTESTTNPTFFNLYKDIPKNESSHYQIEIPQQLVNDSVERLVDRYQIFLRPEQIDQARKVHAFIADKNTIKDEAKIAYIESMIAQYIHFFVRTPESQERYYDYSTGYFRFVWDLGNWMADRTWQVKEQDIDAELTNVAGLHVQVPHNPNRIFLIGNPNTKNPASEDILDHEMIHELADKGPDLGTGVSAGAIENSPVETMWFNEGVTEVLRLGQKFPHASPEQLQRVLKQYSGYADFAHNVLGMMILTKFQKGVRPIEIDDLAMFAFDKKLSGGQAFVGLGLNITKCFENLINSSTDPNVKRIVYKAQSQLIRPTDRKHILALLDQAINEGVIENIQNYRDHIEAVIREVKQEYKIQDMVGQFMREIEDQKKSDLGEE